MNVLFTNCLTFGAYANLKALAASHSCYVMDACVFKITSLDFRVTNLVNPYAPAYETRSYIAQLIEFIRSYKIELLVPLGEEHKYISLFRSEILAALEHPCQIMCPRNFEVFDRFDDKMLFHAFIDSLAIPLLRVPRIVEPRELEEGQKYIVKTRLGKAGFDTYQVDYGRVIKQQPIPEHSYVQEFIEGGRELCIAGVSYAGQTEFIVYRSEIGVNYRFVRDHAVEAELRDAIRTILETSEYEGFFGFDFIEKDGTYCFLECNTRATLGSICLTMELAEGRVLLSRNNYDRLVVPMLGVYSDNVLKSFVSLVQGFKFLDFRYSVLFPLVFMLYYKFRAPGLSQVLSYGFLRSRHHYEYYPEAIPPEVLETLEPAERARYAALGSEAKRATALYILRDKKVLRFLPQPYGKPRGPRAASAGLGPEDMAHIRHILSEKQPGTSWLLDDGDGAIEV